MTTPRSSLQTTDGVTPHAIHVLGALNMDLVVRVPRHPSAGETLAGSDLTMTSGGKGANQAVAAGRLGASTYMHGKVGDDPLSPRLVQSLRNAAVNVTAVGMQRECACGTALITINPQGENVIVISPGANGRVDERDVEHLSEQLQARDIVMLQLEIPMPMVERTARLAHAKGCRIILDPAPAAEISDALLKRTTIVTPNQIEAAMLCGIDVKSVDDGMRAGAALLARGAERVIVKLGADGAVWSDDDGAMHHLPALPADARDTVAAGDAFNGGLAAALARGKRYDEALQWARTAAALCVEREGAQTAMPSLAELQERLPIVV